MDNLDDFVYNIPENGGIANYFTGKAGFSSKVVRKNAEFEGFNISITFRFQNDAPLAVTDTRGMSIMTFGKRGKKNGGSMYKTIPIRMNFGNNRNLFNSANEYVNGKIGLQQLKKKP